MLTLRRLLAAGAVALAGTIPHANAADVVTTYGKTITVYSSPGGLIKEFEARFSRLYQEGYTVIIDGPCQSACTMIIGMMPGRVCATERGQFGFHAAWVPGPVYGRHYPAPDGTRQMARHWTPAVHTWLQAHGGLTPDIKLAAATDFVPACPRGDAGFIIGLTTGIPISPSGIIGASLYNANHPPAPAPQSGPGKDGARVAPTESADRPAISAALDSGEHPPGAGSGVPAAFYILTAVLLIGFLVTFAFALAVGLEAAKGADDFVNKGKR